jgi:hypothetical protein
MTIKPFYLGYLLLACNITMCGQKELVLTQKETGLKVIVTNKNFPLLKILLPGQPEDERGIEVEFPEHVTGLNKSTNTNEHLYLVSNGDRNKRTLPAWKMDENSLTYETDLNNRVKLTAKVEFESNSISYTYSFTNHSNVVYENFQPVTCVQLYSTFSDTLLTRTYVHHSDGFDLLASETPDRLTMSLQQWLPCRYLVSYSWPVPSKRIGKDEDSITRYYKSRKADKPFIATLSHDKKWVAATYTSETGNLWTNPERTCQHADPSISLKPGESKTVRLKTFITRDSLAGLLQIINREQ